jgi:peptidyl-prolyl cis-trans isomerase SurA
MKQLFLAAAAIACLCAAPVGAEIIEQILVKVNGEIITKTELEQRQVSFIRSQRNKQLTEDMLKNDEALKKLLLEVTPQVLLETIDEMLLIQRAKELGYTMGDEQFTRIVENIKKENKLETEEQFQAALKQEGMTITDLRRALERRMMIERVQQSEVFGRLSVNEDEARAYYEQHREQFTKPGEVTLREILVALEAPANAPANTINVGLEEEAQKKAEAIRARVAGGEDFAKVAAEASDAPSKANGGLVGPVLRSELAKAFQDAIANLKAGDVSPVFRTSRGYHLVKLESMTDVEVQPFDKARDEISNRVYGQKRQVEFEKYLKRLRAQAIIEWKSAELKKMWEQRTATEAAAAQPGV